MKVEFEVLTVTVNYDRTIAEGVAVGKYDMSVPDITDGNFSRNVTGTETIEITLVHFGQPISSENVLKGLEELNLRPADIQELLAIGEQYPDKQNCFPIAAPGAAWCDVNSGNRWVAYIVGDDSSRVLVPYWFDRDWLDIFRFAAVRK